MCFQRLDEFGENKKVQQSNFGVKDGSEREERLMCLTFGISVEELYLFLGSMWPHSFRGQSNIE